MNVVLIIKTHTDRLQNLEIITFHEEFNGALKTAGAGVHQSAP